MEPVRTEKTAQIAAVLAGGAAPVEIPETEQAASAEVLPKTAPGAESEQAEPQQDVAQPEQVEIPDEPEPAVSLNDLAETLEVDVKDIYAVEIPIGKDSKATLGELKDAFKSLETITAERDEYDEVRQKSDNELMIARRQTEQLLSMAIDANILTPDVIATMENQQRLVMTRENRSLMAAIPSWKDAATRDDDFSGIAEMMEQYGFSKHEILNIPDHRIVKKLFDDYQLFKMKKTAKANGKNPPGSTGGRKSGIVNKPNALQARVKAAKAQGGTVKTALISDLITGKVTL